MTTDLRLVTADDEPAERTEPFNPVIPGWSDPRNWISFPADEPLPPLVEGWTWERVSELHQAVLGMHADRIPNSDLEYTVMRLAREEAARMVEDLREEVAELARAVVRIERRAGR